MSYGLKILGIHVSFSSPVRIVCRTSSKSGPSRGLRIFDVIESVQLIDIDSLSHYFGGNIPGSMHFGKIIE